MTPRERGKSADVASLNPGCDATQPVESRQSQVVDAPHKAGQDGAGPDASPRFARVNRGYGATPDRRRGKSR